MIILPTPTGNYQLPAGARNAALWINGLRATVGVDYDLVNAEIKPKWEWQPWYVIAADYDAE